MASFPHTVLQVVPALNAGGAERTTADIAAAIVASGGRALVATAGGFLEQEIEEKGGEIIHGPYDAKSPISLWTNSQRLSEILETERVDIIHARSRAPGWSAYVAARRSTVPFITTHHRGYSPTNPIKRLYDSSLLRGDIVIANSQFTADAISADYGVNLPKLRVIPRGVDLAAFDPECISPARIGAVSTGWGINEDAESRATKDGLRLLLPARLTEWKGHKAAIRAVAANKSKMQAGIMPKLTLVFCGGAQGGTKFEASLRALVEELGVREMVHFVGECADMPAAYGWADVVLSPSIKPESFGRAAIEAGAMRRPVIAFGHGGIAETIVDGETGILVAPGDEIALGTAISDFAAMPMGERTAMGARGNKRVTENYSVEIMAAATLDAYREVIAEGKH